MTARSFGLLSTLLLVPALLAQTPPPDLDQLVAGYVEARGGIEKIKAIQTMRSTGKITGQPVEIQVVIEQRRPDQLKMVIRFQGQEMVQAFDGKSGWSINPMKGYGGKAVAEPMTEDELREIKLQADFDGALVDYQSKGYALEYAGTEQVEGSPAHKLRLTRKSGEVQYIYLDTETLLEVKTARKVKQLGNELDVDTYFSEYKDVEGIPFPHLIESGVAGMPARQKIVFDTVELNPQLDPSIFAQPPAPAAEPATPPAKN
jgi:outer membrane lipoprotein-sorting protein